MAVPDCASSYSVLVTFDLEAPDAASPCSVAAAEEARRADIVSLSGQCDRLSQEVFDWFSYIVVQQKGAAIQN